MKSRSYDIDLLVHTEHFTLLCADFVCQSCGDHIPSYQLTLFKPRVGPQTWGIGEAAKIQ